MKYTHADEGIYVSVPETQKLVFERPESMSDRKQWNEAASKFCAEMNRETTAIPPEEQVLSVADPETWGVGDVVRIREDSDGSGSAYWRVGFAYLITEKTTHGTLFVAQDVGDPIEISIGIARRWFRLARKAEKVSEQGKTEERKPRSLREIFCGFKSPSLFVVTELALSPITEKAYLARIDELEGAVRNLREELKERKEEAGDPAERIVEINSVFSDIFAKAKPGEVMTYFHLDGSKTFIRRIQ